MVNVPLLARCRCGHARVDHPAAARCVTVVNVEAGVVCACDRFAEAASAAESDGPDEGENTKTG